MGTCAFERQLQLAGAEFAETAQATRAAAAAVRRHLDRTARALASTMSSDPQSLRRRRAEAALGRLDAALEAAASPSEVRALRRTFAKLAHPDLAAPMQGEDVSRMAEFNARCDRALARLDPMRRG